ncbi:hypothetical protein JKP88DRAFT_272857 [Tribonema minus]|uniref:Uncharacterized protein n=1 Tax=Tribonema minus TaxID=303371 RepID=A0A836CEP8_9STRA|nr:hypothetical protein JKP88DRAFT_272857 [Tribonema minus]
MAKRLSAALEGADRTGGRSAACTPYLIGDDDLNRDIYSFLPPSDSTRRRQVQKSQRASAPSMKFVRGRVGRSGGNLLIRKVPGMIVPFDRSPDRDTVTLATDDLCCLHIAYRRRRTARASDIASAPADAGALVAVHESVLAVLTAVFLSAQHMRLGPPYTGPADPAFIMELDLTGTPAVVQRRSHDLSLLLRALDPVFGRVGVDACAPGLQLADGARLECSVHFEMKYDFPATIPGGVCAVQATFTPRDGGSIDYLAGIQEALISAPITDVWGEDTASWCFRDAQLPNPGDSRILDAVSNAAAAHSARRTFLKEPAIIVKLTAAVVPFDDPVSYCAAMGLTAHGAHDGFYAFTRGEDRACVTVGMKRFPTCWSCFVSSNESDDDTDGSDDEGDE